MPFPFGSGFGEGAAGGSGARQQPGYALEVNQLAVDVPAAKNAGPVRAALPAPPCPIAATSRIAGVWHSAMRAFPYPSFILARYGFNGWYFTIRENPVQAIAAN